MFSRLSSPPGHAGCLEALHGGAELSYQRPTRSYRHQPAPRPLSVRKPRRTLNRKAKSTHVDARQAEATQCHFGKHRGVFTLQYTTGYTSPLALCRRARARLRAERESCHPGATAGSSRYRPASALRPTPPHLPTHRHVSRHDDRTGHRNDAVPRARSRVTRAHFWLLTFWSRMARRPEALAVAVQQRLHAL